MELRPKFLNKMLRWYPQIRLEDAENIYQDAFIAVQENLKKNKIRTDTSWNTYITKIGMNIANKMLRSQGKEVDLDDFPEDYAKPSEMSARVESAVRDLEDEPHYIYNNPLARTILLQHLEAAPRSCIELIKAYYFAGMSDKEVVEEEGTYSSPAVVRNRRSQCMKKFKYKVKLSLYNAGIIDVKPEP